MSFLWHGLTDQGNQVPVQVDALGRVIAVDGTPGGSKWTRTGTTLTPSIPGDDVDLGSGDLFAARVGVGTTSPGYKLEVASDGLNIGVATAGGSSRGLFQADGDGFSLRSQYNNAGFIAFKTITGGSSQERARIDNSGRLLVGTASGSGGALLQVSGDRVRIETAKTPVSASDTGTAGEICWDANYIYVCTATNTWRRSALSAW